MLHIILILFSISFVSKKIDREFRAIVNQVVDDREKNDKRRDDLLQVILDLREKHGREVFNESVVCGHAMTFLTEGYETSSTTMAYTLLEMALNPEIQRKVQTEVDKLLADSKGEITEDVINKLEYLETCLMETVRMHCPVFQLQKLNLQSFELPPQYETSTNTVDLEPETPVIIPVYGLHL